MSIVCLINFGKAWSIKKLAPPVDIIKIEDEELYTRLFLNFGVLDLLKKFKWWTPRTAHENYLFSDMCLSASILAVTMYPDKHMPRSQNVKFLFEL